LVQVGAGLANHLVIKAQSSRSDGGRRWAGCLVPAEGQPPRLRRSSSRDALSSAIEPVGSPLRP